MKIVIDGNDGTGKTTLVNSLRKLGFAVFDRGIPSQLTDGEDICVPEDEFYIILDISVEESQRRLVQAGKNLKEKYHTIEDLRHYKKRFSIIVKQLGKQCVVIDAEKSAQSVVLEVVNILKQYSK